MEKTVAQSYTEQIQIIMPADTNGYRRLFGGRLMEWIDIVAAAVARRHSGKNVTTARVDVLEFQAPAHEGDALILAGKITHVGKTSMEVRVDTFIEALDGTRKQINRAYVIVVALDENECPTQVTKLRLETYEEKVEFENGVKRREMRKNLASILS